MKQISLTVLLLLPTALAAPAQSWTNRLHGPPGNGDYWSGTALAVDTDGNVIITGIFGTNWQAIKYSSTGMGLWTNPAGAPIAVDGSGNVFVIGDEMATIKYSSSGLPQWTNRYDVPAYQKGVESMAADGQGNVIVKGFVRDVINPNDYHWVTLKYSNAGVPLSTNVHDRPGATQGACRRVVVDGEGSVFVCGRVASPLGGQSQHDSIIKYSWDGIPQWTNDIAGEILDMTSDSQGNLLAAGGCWNGSNPDSLLIKFSSAGSVLWTGTFNGSADGDDNAAAGVAVDSQDNVIIGGSSWTGSLHAYLTIKYSSSGLPLWTNFYGATNWSNFNFPSALTVDRSGNVFLTGEPDFATVAYSAAGEPLWTNQVAGGHWGRAIGVDWAGNVFVTGHGGEAGIGDVCITVKYAVPTAQPTLNNQRLGSTVVLSWTNAAFGLQSAPAITATFTNVPGAASPYTNTLSGGQRFFRLAQ